VTIDCIQKSGTLLDPSVVSDFLMEIGATSVAIEDTAEKKENESPASDIQPNSLDYSWNDLLKIKTWSKPSVTAHFPDSFEEQMIISMISSCFDLEKPPVIRMESQEILDRDWLKVSQQEWEPINIGDVTIKFGYEDEVVEGDSQNVGTSAIIPDGRVKVKLIGGAGFGTGGHPTTFMCVKWLQENMQPGLRMLDYGSGSGILGLVALKLGASSVDGIDIDPEALQACYQNAALNEVSMSMYYPREFKDSSGQVCIEALCMDSSEDNVEFQISSKINQEKWKNLIEFQPYDLIVANVLPGHLIDIFKIFKRILKPGGRIALSGLTESQVESVMIAYNKGFKNLEIGDTNEGYALVVGEL